MKWLLLFVFNLAAIVCGLRAVSLICTVQRIYLPRNGAQATCEMSEAAGFVAHGLLLRFCSASHRHLDILIVSARTCGECKPIKSRLRAAFGQPISGIGPDQSQGCQPDAAAHRQYVSSPWRFSQPACVPWNGPSDCGYPLSSTD
jgi:hypothetical protein